MLPWRYLSRTAIQLAAAASMGGLSAYVYAGAVITSGSTSLGVNDTGELNFWGTGPEGFRLYGVYRQGVGDAIAPGCPCEGWGVSVNAGAGPVAVWANQSSGSGGFSSMPGANIFGATSSTASSLITMADAPVTVRQFYGPSLAADVFQAQVTITNYGNTTLNDLTYRRAMDWDVPPTEFYEYVTHRGVEANLVGNGGNVIYASNNGFASSNPLSDPSWGYTMLPTYSGGYVDTVNTDFNKAGPSDHGSVFDFSFGSLGAGQSRVFNIYYGSAPNESSALAAVNQLGVNLYSLGQSYADGTDPANRSTFIFGFGGVGGTELGSTETVPVLPFAPAPGQYTFDAPVSRRWFDPPFATGFTISLVGGDIHSITAPTGFSHLTIIVDGVVVDSDFSAGDVFTFAAGLHSFHIGGLLADLGTASPFPLYMDFDPSVTSMTWTADLAPVPEPAVASMLAAGLGVLMLVTGRRRRA